MLYDKDIREPLFEYIEDNFGKVRIIEEKQIGKSRADVMLVMDEKLIDIETPDGPITMAQAREKYGRRDFNVYRGRLKKTSFFKLLHLPVNPGKPIVDNDKCIACGICEEVCPVNGKAVHSGKGQKAQYDYTKCIRCYCCQEMCPVGAISRK